MKITRILIVEDEPIIAADLEDRLQEMGYEVAQQCTSGEEALAFLEQETVDLILMDVQLEGQLNGIETAQKILEKQKTPLIYLTSNADDATFNKAKNTQPAAFLSKPFRGKDLLHAIELAISRAATPVPETEAPEAGTDKAYLFNDRLFVKVKDRMVRVFFADILWLEADDYYCKIITTDKTLLISHTLKQIGETLSNVPLFMRVHRSYIVNLTHVEEIGELHVHIGKKQIPINKASKEDILTRLQKI